MVPVIGHANPNFTKAGPRRMKNIAFLMLGILWRPALAAADPQLDALRQLLIGMRAKPAAADRIRGATPKLTEAKHLLRDWVESRLVQFPESGGEAVYAGALNSELRTAGLICGWNASDAIRCPDWFQMGYVSMVSLTRSSGFLVLKTGAGIECGYDESSYLYQWSGKQWLRVWDNEQNNYTEKLYKPQQILETLVSPNRRFVMTLGAQSWCSSNWRSVYYRVYRLDSKAPMLDESQVAFEPETLQGRLTDSEALVEYMVASLDPGVHSRKEVRRYQIAGNRLQRVDPVALTPRDFAEVWIGINRHYTAGEFNGLTMSCKTGPDLWQISFTPEGGKPQHYLVQWRRPYHFTMVQVSDRANSSCTVPDPKADETGTLFPDRN